MINGEKLKIYSRQLNARRNILKCTKQLQEAGKEVFYLDTDSIKVLDFDATAEVIIEAYNAEIDRC